MLSISRGEGNGKHKVDERVRIRPQSILPSSCWHVLHILSLGKFLVDEIFAPILAHVR